MPAGASPEAMQLRALSREGRRALASMETGSADIGIDMRNRLRYGDPMVAGR
jgi:hypothetical protein